MWVGTSDDTANKIYHAESRDGINFSGTECIIVNDKKWKHLYRPALLIYDGMFYCFYGVIRLDGKWMIGLSKGPGIHQMTGITANEIPDKNGERIAYTRKMGMKEMQNRLKSSLVTRMMPIILPVLAIEFATGSVIMGLLAGIVLCALLSFLKFDKKNFFRIGVINGLLCTMTATFLQSVFMEIIKMIR